MAARLPDCSLHGRCHLRWVLVLPEPQDPPARINQRSIDLAVSLDVPPELRPPVIVVGPWPHPMLGANVPEAAVNQDDEPFDREDDVDHNGPITRLDPVVLSEPKAGRVNGRPHGDLRPRIDLPVPLHHTPNSWRRGTGAPGNAGCAHPGTLLAVAVCDNEPVPREDVLRDLIALLSSAAVLEGNGWPATVTFHDGVRQTDVDIYVSRIGDPGAGAVGARAPHERRWQNPGQGNPIMLSSSRPTLLLGLADQESDEQGDELAPVIAAFDATRHANRPTRISVQMHVDTLRNAARDGHAVQLRKNGEIIVAFRPELMGAYIDSIAPLIHRGERVATQDAEEVTVLFDLLEETELKDEAAPEVAEAAQRKRREVARSIVTRRVRDRRFARDVRQAYGGRCAMCGITLGMAIGAHIDPVEADGPDEVRNGLALCPTHHTAFDTHLVLVDEEDGFAISLNDDRVAQLRELGQAEGLDKFTRGLRDRLLLPARPHDHPLPEYFKRRRDYYFHPEEAEFYEGEDELR